MFLDHEGIDPRDLYDEDELGHCEVIPDIAWVFQRWFMWMEKVTQKSDKWRNKNEGDERKPLKKR